MEKLRVFGGLEFAAIAGAVLAARRRRLPVLLDGYACTAAAAALAFTRPGALDHCLIGHCSAEPGHARLLARLGKRPLLNLGMRLGEATGAAVALSVLRAGLACHAGMAELEAAGGLRPPDVSGGGGERREGRAARAARVWQGAGGRSRLAR